MSVNHTLCFCLNYDTECLEEQMQSMSEKQKVLLVEGKLSAVIQRDFTNTRSTNREVNWLHVHLSYTCRIS